MLQNTGEDLDILIIEEKKRVALEYFEDAWSSAISEGIEADIVADTAISTAITQLIETGGEHQAEELIKELRKRFDCGDFLIERTVQ